MDTEKKLLVSRSRDRVNEMNKEGQKVQTSTYKLSKS